MTSQTPDERLMSHALALARVQLGKVAPNPAVGCVLVLDGQIVGEGATGAGGRPHAEEIALERAGDQARGATVYVTLEPCNARSSGARSCSRRLIEAGVVRVVVACEDPNPPAAHGVSHMGAAGVEVLLGVLRVEAETLNRGFFKRVTTGRPWIAIDADSETYDDAFDPAPGESLEAALDRLGGAGHTRVCVRPGSALAVQLTAIGLVDEDNS